MVTIDGNQDGTVPGDAIGHPRGPRTDFGGTAPLLRHIEGPGPQVTASPAVPAPRGRR
ncbi:hypothetical protein OIU91_21660 [Streptomyces sp. NBC_01456]|uniref:hypothetical protein n=1 Tax=unclassified Streptomyces TaxID=2593676 RepID=UPI002E3537FB|nr:MULTISPECIES: hypothetical protein [unclassified Streptomyces]